MSAKSRKAFEAHARASGAVSLLPATGVTFRDARTEPPPPAILEAESLEVRANGLMRESELLAARAEELYAAARVKRAKV